MKTKLLILIIGLALSSQLAAQPARWENNMDELIHRLQPLSKEGPISDQQILTALQGQGLGIVSPAEIHKLKHLLRQDSPRGILERELRRLSADNYLPDHESNRSLRNSVPITKANGQPFTAAEQNAITQVLEDFQVNENVGRCDHYDPAVAMDANGNFVVTWCDERNGKSDIYAQRYNSDGSKQGCNFKVNDDPWVYKQYTPAIAMDASGNFVITWSDGRRPGYPIYAQRFDKIGNKQGVNFIVSKATTGGLHFNPSIAIDDNGNFIIVWGCNYGNGSYYDIYAQRFDKDGNTLGENFRVNDDTGKNQKCEPCVSVDGAGNFVIAWEDDRNGNEDIYAQRYDKNGNKQGVNFRVNSDVGNSDQSHPGVGMDRNGNCVICWSDRNTAKIYAQRYESNGNILGVNFQVNDKGWCYEPAITVDGTGRFVIAWKDNYNYSSGLGYDIYAQCYDKDGNKQGGNFLVNDEGNASAQFDPSIAINGSGNFIITWLDTRNGYEDIYAQRYSNFGSKQGVNFRVTDDEGSTNQNNAKIAVDESGVFVITWDDERNNIYRYIKDRDIYAQRYSSDGNRQGQNFRVNDDLGSSSQMYPAIAIDGSGNFIITWEDYRNGNPDIYAQRYRSDGAKEGINFLVNDDGGNNFHSSPTIGADGSGNFLIAWADERKGHNIYVQRYNADGSKQGLNFQVNDNDPTRKHGSPSLDFDNSGNFVIAWPTVFFSGDCDIYAQRYDHSGNPIGVNYRVNNDTGNQLQDNPDVKLVNGQIYYTWQDNRIEGQGWDIFARVDLFSKPGVLPLGYPNLGEIIDKMNATAAAFPKIAKVFDLTATYNTPTTFEGRHIYVIKISDNVAKEEDEPDLLIVSNHHAREVATPVIALHAIEQFTTKYGSDPQITAAVDNNEIWIAPTWNPDGYNFVFNVNRTWRKNRRVFPEGIGVDLNRNYPHLWDSQNDKAPGIADLTNDLYGSYRGPFPASEAETQTMIAFASDQIFEKLIDFHSRGREVVFGYCEGNPDHPFIDWLKKEAEQLSIHSGYGGAVSRPSGDGENFEWHLARFGTYAFLVETVEKSQGFAPPYEIALSEANIVWPGIMWVINRPIPLSGCVTDKITGNPVSANIELDGVEFKTGETNLSGGLFGRYHVFAPPETYNIRFSAKGYLPYQCTIAITDVAKTLDIQLVPDPTAIKNPIALSENENYNEKLILKCNYPNPFNSEAIISYQIKETGNIQIVIYDLSGRHIKTILNSIQNPGSYNVAWNATNESGHFVASNTYLYRIKLTTPDNIFAQVGKMVLLR